jgi:hypothetical protein
MILLGALLVAFLGSSALEARAGQLGAVVFPTSSSPTVQPAIEQGLTLLHSFQYDEASTVRRRGSA